MSPPTQSVAELCESCGLTLNQLTEQSGLAVDRVAAIAAGRWTPSPQERAAIAKALGVEVQQIAWGHKTPIQHLYGHGPG